MCGKVVFLQCIKSLLFSCEDIVYEDIRFDYIIDIIGFKF